MERRYSRLSNQALDHEDPVMVPDDPASLLHAQAGELLKLGSKLKCWRREVSEPVLGNCRPSRNSGGAGKDLPTNLEVTRAVG
jgi:hypothetical protein